MLSSSLVTRTPEDKRPEKKRRSEEERFDKRAERGQGGSRLQAAREGLAPTRSTVTGIAEGRAAILVTVDAFRLSDAVLNSKMSTVTGIAEGRVAILVTVHVFGLSHLLGNSKVSTPHLQNKIK